MTATTNGHAATPRRASMDPAPTTTRPRIRQVEENLSLTIVHIQFGNANHPSERFQSGYAVPTGVPMMTSFRDLAAQSPMGSSAYSLGGRSEIGPDIPEEGELDEFIGSRRPSKADGLALFSHEEFAPAFSYDVQVHPARRSEQHG